MQRGPLSFQRDTCFVSRDELLETERSQLSRIRKEWWRILLDENRSISLSMREKHLLVRRTACDLKCRAAKRPLAQGQKQAKLSPCNSSPRFTLNKASGQNWQNLDGRLQAQISWTWNREPPRKTHSPRTTTNRVPLPRSGAQEERMWP